MNRPTPRLAAVDEANLTLDHAGQVNVFLVAGLLSRGGFVGLDGNPDMSLLRRALSERIKTLPQLRRVATVMGRGHGWKDVSPDLEHHVRLIPAVEGVGELEHLCARLMCVPLARDRPLWELLVAPGVTASEIAVVLRIHHAIADGMAAVAIVQQLFEGEARQVSSSRSGAPEPVPTPVPSLGRVARVAARLHRISATLLNHDVGETALLGKRSAVRGVKFLSVDLGALESHVEPQGGTVNDALLCAVAAGYRAALPAMKEPVPHRLPVSVPVALKRRAAVANQVGVMLVRLPLDEPDPDKRLQLIAEQTRREKPQAREQGTLELMRGPVGARLMDYVGQRQRLVGGFVTNVPGPTGSLRLCGAPVTAIWPIAVLAGNVRSGVAAVSYRGRLRCAIHFDAANIPGSVFAEAMAQELDRLTGAVARRRADPQSRTAGGQAATDEDGEIAVNV